MSDVSTLHDPVTLRHRLEGRVERLPVLPSASQRLLALDGDAPDHFERCLEIVESDPGLAVRTLSLANSAASSPSAHIDSVRTALSRLGGAAVNRMALTLSISSSLGGAGPETAVLWHHALLVGSVARRLHAHLRLPSSTTADEAYTVGLLHDVGHFILLFEAPEFVESLCEEGWQSPAGLLEAELATLGTTHAHLGQLACSQWGLPERIGEVVGIHHEPVGVVDDAVSALQLLVQFSDHVMFPWINELGIDGDPGYVEFIVHDVADEIPESFDVTPDDLTRIATDATVDARRTITALGLD